MSYEQIFKQALEQIENIGAESTSDDPIVKQMFKIANDALCAEDISDELSREIDNDLDNMKMYPVWEKEV